MTDELRKMIAAARHVHSSQRDREEQRRSFAFGNTSYENPAITRAMVDEQADRMAREAETKPAALADGPLHSAPPNPKE